MQSIHPDDLLHIAHGGEDPYGYCNAVVPPIFMNSLHLYGTEEEYENGAYVYGRHGNPLVEIVEEKLRALENGQQALVFASGMAATSAAIFHACKTGDHIVCQSSCYGPVKRLLDTVCAPKLGIEVTYLSYTDLAELEAAIRPNTALLMFESPSTFVFDIVDIAGVVAIAKRHGVKTYIDNTYCTPLYQKPLDLGVDYVMHTASKYLGGHSDLIGGVLVVNEGGEELKSTYRELFGGIIGPMEGWLLMRGLRTLHPRLVQHEKTALTLAQYLQGHPKVQTVYHPGLPSHLGYERAQTQMKGTSGLFSIELDASLEKSYAFVNALKLFGKGCSWGGFESLAILPLSRSTEAECAAYHASNRLIRLHAGLEGEENLRADLEQALAQL